MSRKCLVTGGAGFVGSHLVDALVKRGWQVRTLDNLSTGSLENLSAVQDAMEFIHGDIREFETVRRAATGAEVVFHLAALGSVPRSIDDPLTSNAVNVDGTLNVLRAAQVIGARRVVFSSSSSAYGNSPTLPKHEEMPANPRSPYAVSKHTGELYTRVFAAAYGLETLSLRYFNIFGPRQNPNSQYAAVIPKFISLLRQGLPPPINGDGEHARDFTYVDNAVHANLLAADAPNAQGQVCNIACGAKYTLNHLVRAINAILGTAVEPVYGTERAGDVRESLADIRLAGSLLGYHPLVDFETGLRRTVDWHRPRT